jgi:hypothetical protein
MSAAPLELYICHAPWLVERRQRLASHLAPATLRWHSETASPGHPCPAPFAGLTAPENDAFARHWSLLDRFLASGQPRAVVFEDDAIPGPYWADRLRHEVFGCLPEADLVMLSAEHWPALTVTPYSALADRIDGANTLVGYVVTRAAAAALLTTQVGPVVPVDWYVTHALRAAGLLCLRLREPLVVNGSLRGHYPSAIAADQPHTDPTLA